MNNIRTAVVLVAGTGSRLRPLTDNAPKALVPLGTETILARLLRQLEACGIVHVVFATGFFESALRAAVSSSRVTFDFCFNQAYGTTQNAISLGCCADALAGEPFVKLDGDLVLDQRIIERVVADASPFSVAVDRTRKLDSEAMKVQLGTDNSIVDFGKGLPAGSADAESVGIESLDARSAGQVLGRIKELVRANVVDRYYEDVYAELIRESRIAAHAVEVSPLVWTEVDDFEDLHCARQLIQADRL
jgi:choline kinase